MASIQVLKKKAQACLDKKANMPMSPLFNMANVAKRNATGDLKYLQDAIDYLTCKAKAKLNFDEDDKEFLKELYEAFWWGGQYEGYAEAAQLANYYVNGEGNSKDNPLRLDAELYKTAKIVIAAMTAMKLFIADQKKTKKPFFNIQCDNIEFRAKNIRNKIISYELSYRRKNEVKRRFRSSARKSEVAQS